MSHVSTTNSEMLGLMLSDNKRLSSVGASNYADRQKFEQNTKSLLVTSIIMPTGNLKGIHSSVFQCLFR